jgi:LL-diaminopimelate aminotransferase
VIIFDAAYSAFIRDPELSRSIFEIEGAGVRAEIQSFSKSAGFTGVRLGWTVVPRDLTLEDGEPGKVNRLWRRRQSTFFNGPSNVVQAGGVAALSDVGLAECQVVIDHTGERADHPRGAQRHGPDLPWGRERALRLAGDAGRMPSWAFFDRLLEEGT